MRTKILFLCLAMLFVAFMGCGGSSGDITLNVGVGFEGNSLVIVNRDLFSYDNIKIELNDGQFKKVLPFSIPAGQYAKYDLTTFKKSDGERFNFLKYSLVDISIFCDVSKEVGGKWDRIGRGFYYGKFR